MLGGALAQRGDVDRGRGLAESAQVTLEELGHRLVALTYGATVRGEIELLTGEGAAAERIFRSICDGLSRGR